MTLKDLANKFKLDLSTIYDEEEAHALFLITLEHVLKYGRGNYLLKKEEVISTESLNKLDTILTTLQTGKPIQYITGSTKFYGLPFKVNPSVLIPRPETEELVEWIIEEVKSYELTVTNNKFVNRQSSIKYILDIGTGSGCIAIALKKNLPDVTVYAVDIARDSLEIAKQNAELNKVDVEFIQDDILYPRAIESQISPHTPHISIIVSNPPYITENEKSGMHENVLANEPHSALFVSNENPLIFYEAITDFALKNLTKNGLLFFEINEYLGKQTIDLLKCKGFINIELRKDMHGKDRMIKANNPNHIPSSP